MDPTFLNRNVNQGFSGGEKKRTEILQLAVLEVRGCAAQSSVSGCALRRRGGHSGQQSSIGRLPQTALELCLPQQLTLPRAHPAPALERPTVRDVHSG